jgi:hypothetical protein
MVVMDTLLVTPVPVDLRMWHRDVTLGWKTVEQAQAELDADPTTHMALKIQALALVPHVAYALITELRTETYSRLVVFTQFRDVIVSLQDLCREQGVNVVSLYPGTPDKKRTAGLRKFNHTSHYPILAIQLKGVLNLGAIDSKEWLWLDGWEISVPSTELPGRTRVVKRI